jgi:hypothetical protein
VLSLAAVDGNATTTDIENQLMGDAYFKGNVTTAIKESMVGQGVGVTVVVRTIDVVFSRRRLEESAQVRQLAVQTATVTVTCDITGTTAALDTATNAGAASWATLDTNTNMVAAAAQLKTSVKSMSSVADTGAALAVSTDSLTANCASGTCVTPTTTTVAPAASTSGAVTMGLSSALVAAIAFFTM